MEPCLEVSSGSRRLTFSRGSAWLRLQLTLLHSQVPVGRGEVKRARWLACQGFFSADFSSRQFSEASLQHGERRHIKDSWSCCELGFQKRTAKGYLHTCSKAFFTPRTPLLAARYVQQVGVGVCQVISEIRDVCRSWLFGWITKMLIFKAFICNCPKYQCHQQRIWSLCRW